MNPPSSALFPCSSYPEETRSLRLLGLYNMASEGLVMQRVKVPSGRLTVSQWRRLAELAREFTPGYPLHLTTRQDVELHGLTPDRVPAVQQALAAAGMTTFRAAGDTLRNVTCCPGCGQCGGSVDVLRFAQAIEAECNRLPWLDGLPRKFKICLSGCTGACVRPFIHDIGLVAREDGRFDVTVAGSLGAKPGTGIPYPEPLTPADVLRLVRAALTLFHAEGDRENRRRARLRHVRERMGDGAFLAKLGELFDGQSAIHPDDVPGLSGAAAESTSRVRLRLPLGDLDADRAIALADALSASGAELRIGIEHDLHIFGAGTDDLPADLARLAAAPAIVACPGSTWCEFGIADSRAAAAALLEAGCLDPDTLVCISGCPNSCAHAAVADIGLTGRLATVDGNKTPAFRLLAGGGKGKTPQPAHELAAAIPATEVAAAVRILATAFREAARNGKSPAELVSNAKEELSGSLPSV